MYLACSKCHLCIELVAQRQRKTRVKGAAKQRWHILIKQLVSPIWWITVRSTALRGSKHNICEVRANSQAADTFFCKDLHKCASVHISKKRKAIERSYALPCQFLLTLPETKEREQDKKINKRGPWGGEI